MNNVETETTKTQSVADGEFSSAQKEYLAGFLEGIARRGLPYVARQQMDNSRLNPHTVAQISQRKKRKPFLEIRLRT